MTIETPGTGSKLASIQYLRAAAALGVVLYHAGEEAGTPFKAGAYGVTLFFVISGFIMVTITNDRSRPAAFLADRARRVVPVYWLATFATLAGMVTIGRGYGEGVADLAASLAFLPYGDAGAGRHYFPLLHVGWTLNYEMMFYVLFAGALFLPRRLQLLALTAVFLSLAALGELSKPATAPFEFWCDPIILQFLVGAWMGAAVKPGGAALPGRLACVGLVGLLWLAPETRTAALLLAAAIALERRRAVPSFRFPLLLGDASYSLYLWHVLAITAVAMLVNRFGMPPLLILPVGTGAGVVAGLVSYKLLEEPLLRFLRRKAPPRQASPSPS